MTLQKAASVPTGPPSGPFSRQRCAFDFKRWADRTEGGHIRKFIQLRPKQKRNNSPKNMLAPVADFKTIACDTKCVISYRHQDVTRRQNGNKAVFRTTAQLRELWVESRRPPLPSSPGARVCVRKAPPLRAHVPSPPTPCARSRSPAPRPLLPTPPRAAPT